MKKNKGITLVALVVTIIVLLILAAVSINLVLGENGIITRAKEGRDKTKEENARDEVKLAWLEVEQETLIEGLTVEEQVALLETILKKQDPDATVTNNNGNISTHYKGYDISITEGEEIIVEYQYGYIITGTGNLYQLSSLPANEEIDLSTQTPLLQNIKQVQGTEDAAMALTYDGKVYTWGMNEYGEAGTGSDEFFYRVPQCISDIVGNALNGVKIEKIYRNSSTSYAIDEAGKVYAWGPNGDGVIGDGTSDDRLAPVCISEVPGSVLKTVEIAEVIDDACLLDKNGKLYIWGDNTYGQLGNGDINNVDASYMPICISDIDVYQDLVNNDSMTAEQKANKIKNVKLVKVYKYYDYVMAIDENGKLYTWGHNTKMNLGYAADTFGNAPEYVSYPVCINDAYNSTLQGVQIKSINEEDSMAVMALDTQNRIYVWGNNEEGGIGFADAGTTVIYPKCLTLISGTQLYNKVITKSIARITGGIVLTDEGKVYGWGTNGGNTLGSDTSVVQEPICLNDLENSQMQGKFIKDVVYSDGTVFAIDNQDNIYGWGNNYFGELGDGTKNSSAVPTCLNQKSGHLLNGKKIKKVYANAQLIVQDDQNKVYIIKK